MVTSSTLTIDTLVPVLLKEPTTKSDILPETMVSTSVVPLRDRSEKNDIRMSLRVSIPRKVVSVLVTFVTSLIRNIKTAQPRT